MSLQSVTNILIGSTMQFLDKKLIIGEVDATPIAIFNVLKKSMEYALKKYNNGEISYYEKIKTINRKIQDLKYQCDDICIYRDKFVIKNVFPLSIPVIENNSITRPIRTSYQILPQSQVIYNYQNEDESPVNKIRFIEKTDSFLVNVNSQPMIINEPYSASASISVKPNDSTNTFLTVQKDGQCFIVSVNTLDFNNAIQQGHRILEFDAENAIVFQYLQTTSGGATTIINYIIPTTLVGNTISGNFKIKVQSLANIESWSNTATINLNFTPDCETIENCVDNTQKSVAHASSYIFTPADFGLVEGYDKIKFLATTYNTGTLRWKEHLLMSGNVVPVIITKADLENGDLYWFPSSTAQQVLTINFKIAKENSYNYCNNSNNFTLTKMSIG